MPMTPEERQSVFLDGYHAAWFNCADSPSVAGNEALHDEGEPSLSDAERHTALIEVDKMTRGRFGGER